MKDEYIGSKFFDATASAFIMPSLHERINREPISCTYDNQGKNNSAEYTSRRKDIPGSGLGPDWATKSTFKNLVLDTPGRLNVRFVLISCS